MLVVGVVLIVWAGLVMSIPSSGKLGFRFRGSAKVRPGVPETKTRPDDGIDSLVFTRVVLSELVLMEVGRVGWRGLEMMMMMMCWVMG